MRLLHTADWHFGRTLEGRSRQAEQEAFMDELNQIVKSEKIDAVIMAGDVFDSVNPPAASETLFYEGISQLSNHGERPVVVISGNHDSPDRVQAAAPLADTQSIKLVGKPVQHSITIPVISAGETMVISAVPYPSESRLNEVLSEVGDESALQAAYDQRVARLFELQAQAFSKETVNIAMSHLFVAGGKESDSERPIQIGGAYTVSPTSLPQDAQYVALGHLHRSQTIGHALAPTRYSGSPLAYSFSEANQSKSVTIIDVKPNQEAEWHEVYLSAGKPLVKWRARNGISEVMQWLEEGRDPSAWIDLEIDVIDTPSLQEIQQLRKLHDGFIHIRPIFKDIEEAQLQSRHADLPIEELFQRFYRKQTGGASADDQLVELFLDIINESASSGSKQSGGEN